SVAHLWPLCSLFICPPQPYYRLFPYTTLFRSDTRTSLLLHLGEALFAMLTVRPERADLFLSTSLEPTHKLDHQRRPSNVRYQQRSEEHTSELQSPDHLVCRLLLEKKKQS